MFDVKLFYSFILNVQIVGKGTILVANLSKIKKKCKLLEVYFSKSLHS